MTAPDATQGPLITVIALCFNHARFVDECLDAIAAQTYRNVQLIVTDDASTDDSALRIAEWIARHWPQAQFIRHGSNRGICATLNEALAVARGDFIAMVATDDRWDPHRLEAHASLLPALNPRTAVVFSDAQVVDENGQPTDPSFIDKHRPGFAPAPDRIFRDLVDANFIPAMCATIRTQTLRDVGGYDESLTYEDYDMWLRLSAAGHRFEFVPGVLSDYRIVSTSMARTILSRKNPDRYYTEFAIHRKCLQTAMLSSEQRQRLLARIEFNVYQLYLAEDRRAGRGLLYLGRKLRNGWRYAVLGLLDVVGIRRSMLKRWFTLLGKGT